ncbi:MAG: DUF4838 domain-containing protein, partial [Lentisphaerae bacterium]|nr:DUF4838 domain-containing protein [Lentisphaerota bacterium]
KLSFEFKNPEEIMIAANEKHLVIAGRDIWDPDNMFILGRGGIKVMGTQEEYGTCNAVYTFLQRYLGVRWLWWGELGEDILPQETIAFTPFHYRYHPKIRQRSSIFGNTALRRFGKIGETVSDWARYQRLQLDSLNAPVGGHGFGGWFKRFHEDHPEYFALQPDGSRSGFPGPNAVKMCVSNPKLWDQWIELVAEEVKKDPSLKYFSSAANDNWPSGHCICENCRAWDHPDGEKQILHWQGLTQEYVSLSNREIRLANELGKLLKKRFPDKDYHVVTLAYGAASSAPIDITIVDNVIVADVAQFICRPGEKRRKDYKEWGKLTRNHFWRTNAGNPARWMQGGPGDARQMIEDLRFAAENECIGILVDMIWYWELTQGRSYYILAQLAWNPFQDGNAVLNDYYKRAFGPAADQVKAYWELIEDVRRKIVKVPIQMDEYDREVPGSPKTWSEEFNPALFEQADKILSRAEEAVKGAPEIYANRVDYTRASYDFLRATSENLAIHKVDPHFLDDETNAENHKKLVANWEKIKDIHAKYPGSLRTHEFRSGGTPSLLSDIVPEESYLVKKAEPVNDKKKGGE